MTFRLLSSEEMEKIITNSEENIHLAARICTFQLQEHLLNEFVKLDSVTHRVMLDHLAAILERQQLFDEQIARPMPNDFIYQMMVYTMKAIQNISRSPSKKMMKESVMQPTNKLKRPTNKTMNWLAKRPGQTVREKIGSKNRILIERNVYTLQTPENVVTVKVIKELQRHINARIQYRGNPGKFDQREPDIERVEKMLSFNRLASSIMKSEFSDIKVKPVTIPNNKLIDHKDYSMLWRSYGLLNNRLQSVTKALEHLLQRTVPIVALLVMQNLMKLNNVYIVDQCLQLEDTGNQIMCHHQKQLQFKCFYDAFIPARIIKLSDRNFGFLRVKGYKENVFFQTHLIDKFDEPLQLNSIRYVKVKETPRGLQVSDVALENRQIAIEVAAFDQSIGMVIKEFKDGHVEKVVRKEISFDYSDKEEIEMHGVPFSLSIDQTKQIDFFGDYHGIHKAKRRIVKWLQEEFLLPEMEEEETTTVDIECNVAVLDWTGLAPTIYTDSMKQEIGEIKLVHLPHTMDPESLYLQHVNPHHKAIYPLHSKWMHYSMIFNERIKQKDVTNYLKLSQRFKEKLPFTSKHLLYFVPDYIVDFKSQARIQMSMNARFTHAQPVWRSVAACLTYAHSHPLMNGQKLLVMDFTGTEVTVTQLQQETYNNEPILLRFQSIEIELDEKLWLPLDQQWLYLQEYIEKYQLQISTEYQQNIIDSGFIEQCLQHKSVVHFLHPKTNEIIDFTYDASIVREKIKEEQVKHKHSLLRNVKDALQGVIKKQSFEQLIVLTPSIVNKEIIKDISNEIGVKDTRYSDDHICKFMSSETIQEKLANDIPLWREFLPNLSLEVVSEAEGHFGKLRLIEDKKVDSVLGKTNVFEVVELLSLPANKESYAFPLIRGGKGIQKTEYTAFIRDEVFPIDTDIVTKLSIEYKYGDENSYRLKLKPVGEEHPPFKEIIAEWKEDQEETNPTREFISNPPLFDASILAERLQAGLFKFERGFNPRNTIEGKCDTISKLVTSTLYVLKALACHQSKDVQKHFNDFYIRPAFNMIQSFAFMDRNQYQDESNETKRIIEFAIQDAQKYLAALGQYIVPTDYKLYIDNFEYIKEEMKIALIFHHSKNPIILNYFRQQIGSRQVYDVIRGIRQTLWQDSDVLVNLYQFDPNTIKQIIQEIKRKFHTLSNSKKLDRRQASMFRDYAEVLLAVLQLRQFDDFKELESNQIGTKKLARDIRTIDLLRHQNNLYMKVFLSFNIDKPNGLRNMSDLAFALNEFLLGGEHMNYVEVKEINYD